MKINSPHIVVPLAAFILWAAPASALQSQAAVASGQAAPAGPSRSDVEAVAIAAMAAAAAQARDVRGADDPGSRPAREVFATTEAVRSAMIEAARREIGKRWNGTVYIPETPQGAEAIKICLGKLGCWSISIKINIESA